MRFSSLAIVLIFAGTALAQTAQPASQPTTKPLPKDVEKLTDVVYGNAGEKPLLCDIYRLRTPAESPRPAIVQFHGGGWNHGDKSSTGLAGMRLVKAGFVLVSVDYRLSTEAIFPAQINDAKCAVRFLREHAKEYNIDPERIGAMGGSAGGHLAALLGTAGDAAELEGDGGSKGFSSKVQAVADLWGPANLASIASQGNSGTVRDTPTSSVSRLLGGTVSSNKDKALAASPISYISADDPPFLIIHGDADPTVPLAQSQEFFDALKKTGVDATFKIAPGFGHGVKGEEYEKMVIEFFEKHLKQ
jgi:acetyl esterase/lipase